VFAIFEPITFQSARSVCHLRAENTFTNNSGAEVPNATIVRPITKGDIPSFVAIDEAQLTSTSAHLIRTTNQKTRYT